MTPIIPSREASLGHFHRLPDILTLDCIFVHLEPKELCVLSEVSRYLHVFARNDRLWRRLFFASRDPSALRLVFRGTWLLTFLFSQPKDDAAFSSHPLATHPIQVHGVVSEYLHQQWIKSNMYFGQFYPPPALPPKPTNNFHQLQLRPIPVEDYQLLDRETFYRRYGYPNQPVMLRNSGVESWPAWEQWSLDALLAKHGNTPFRVSNIDSNTEPTFLLEFQDFVHYVRHNKDLDPLYLFDPRFADTVPEMETAYEVPKYFDLDYFSLLSPEARPPYRWMLIGPQRTGAPWHTDPSGTSAWNTLLSGHKRWALYPPHIIPPGHDPTSPDRLTSVSWYLDVYPYLAPELRPLEIVQYPGQTIFVPSGWWHMVINMDDTVAVTQNFADEANILQIRRWEILREKLAEIRPDLAPAVGIHPEESILETLKKEASWVDPLGPDSILTWKGRVQDVIKSTLGSAYEGPISSIHGGQNVCFLTDRGFIKFFTPMHEGLESYKAEVVSNEIILHSSIASTDPILLSPKVLGYGYLLDEKDALEQWRWPFIVTEIARSSKNESLEIVPAEDYLPLDESGYRNLLEPLMRTLHHYHRHPLPSSVGGDQSTDQFEQRLRSAVMNHMRWRVFPKHLLTSLPEFLPNDSKAVFDPLQGHKVASLVHGDISPSNILGSLSSLSSTSSFSSFSSPLDSRPHFTPEMLIDFGDASLQTDPLLDYISVFVTVMNCRQEKTLIDLLLKHWEDLPSGNGTQEKASLRRRCMWHVLMWPSAGLSMHLVRCIPNIGEMETWDDVEQAVFGWWN
ncbi:histone arginine demethylase JMJD6 [Entomortierella parvispora]|uniref:Histone arginine demethylase JMJD6 n=1 Tax=Entomortierella parvispora TaxID=205924 RepID=A0A9P3H4I4_9FUNG|nr:histone arginine demethylase JMJD6 [Entomortierella parvispora]